MKPRQRVTILGSTGSVGATTLAVLSLHPEQFEVFALSAATRVDLLLAQCVTFKPRFAVMASAPHAQELARQLKANGIATEVLTAPDALDAIASHEDVDIVMAAIVGAAGLASCIAAALAGKRLLLANKEALVVGAEFFLDAVRTGGATLLPIDSEHSAIFQCLPADRSLWRDQIDCILLTSSGGPFRTQDVTSFSGITAAQACAHPNFSMGRKISVDSATMMNKALEVIEARWLFDLAPEQIKVLIHPQQIIHSMVQFRDGSVLAQLGTPDMRVPVACGLAWPDRIESGAQRLDFQTMSAMTFEAADTLDHRQRFPGLQMAWDALRAPAGTTAVLNAANEVAVDAFLTERIRFDQIHHVNRETLDQVVPSKPSSVGDLLELDDRTRNAARAVVHRFAA